VAGHKGMVDFGYCPGSSVKGKFYLTCTPAELDLRNQNAVADFFIKEKPVHVFLAAAKVGGIMANNTYRAEFLYDNLMIEANIIHHSYF